VTVPILRYAVLLPLLACSSNEGRPGAEWPYAVAGSDCAPWDGPAFSLTLAREASSSGEPGYPLLHLNVYHPQDEVLGHTFEFSPTDTQEGGGSYCRAAEACVATSEVWIRFEQLKSDSTVAGKYRFTLPDGHHETGSFHARFAARQAMCG